MKRHTGFVLICALVLLSLMGMFALIGMQRAITGQKLLANLHQQQLAFQQAETTMSYCQQQLAVLWHQPLSAEYQMAATGLSRPLVTAAGLVILPHREYLAGEPLLVPSGAMPAGWREHSNWSSAQINRIPLRPAAGLLPLAAECMVEQWRLSESRAGKPDLAYLITVRARVGSADSAVWLQMAVTPPGTAAVRQAEPPVQVWRQILHRDWGRS